MLLALKLLLTLASFVAKQAGMRQTEKAILNELEIVLGKRVRAAADARDAVLSGELPEQPDDPNRRD